MIFKRHDRKDKDREKMMAYLNKYAIIVSHTKLFFKHLGRNMAYLHYLKSGLLEHRRTLLCLNTHSHTRHYQLFHHDFFSYRFHHILKSSEAITAIAAAVDRYNKPFFCSS